MKRAETPRNFLFATWEGGGSVTPALTVARKLAARGHRVRVMSDRCNRAEAEASGAGFVAWRRAPSRPDRSKDSDVFRDWEVPTPQEQFGRVVERIMTGPALAYAEDVIEELRREPADLVVSSEMLLGVQAGCEAIRQRLALLTCNISLFPMAGVPPLGPGFTPPGTAEERALHADVEAANRRIFDSGLPALNGARTALGLTPLATVPDQLLAAEAMLLGTSRGFDFAPERLPPRVRYVGPQIDEPAWAKPWRSPWRADDPRPLALVGFSTSFQDHVGVLQRVSDVVGGLPMRAVITLGGTIEPGELRTNEKVQLLRSAPHDAVMREADLVVTHGGHGTVVRALSHLRPMLIIPHGRDQNDNAVRVTARGAGLSLDAGASTEEIRAALERLIGDPAFAAAARTLGSKVAAEVAGSPVVEELEALAAPARPQPAPRPLCLA